MNSPSPQSAVQTSGKGSKFAKIALIFLGLVLLVLLSEFGYLWYTQRAGLPQESSLPKSSSLVGETPDQQAPAPQIFGASLVPEKASTLAETLQRLSDANKDAFFRSADVVLLSTGDVSEAKAEEKIEGSNYYVYKITIQAPQQNSFLVYWFTQSELDNARVTLIQPNQQTQNVSVKDIVRGDSLTIRENIDLLDTAPDSRLFLEVRRGAL